MLLAWLTPCAVLAATPPHFASAAPLLSDTGHALIEWEAKEAITLEIAGNANFADARTLYQGTNKAFFISGLTDGDYYLRLRVADGAKTEPLLLEVRHQSLQRALWLALLGAVVTIAVVVTILKGTRDE
jgi:hypothetical protein